MSETVTKVNGIPLDELMYRFHKDVAVIPQEIVVGIKTKGEKDEE